MKLYFIIIGIIGITYYSMWLSKTNFQISRQISSLNNAVPACGDVFYTCYEKAHYTYSEGYLEDENFLPKYSMELSETAQYLRCPKNLQLKCPDDLQNLSPKEIDRIYFPEIEPFIVDIPSIEDPSNFKSLPYSQISFATPLLNGKAPQVPLNQINLASKIGTNIIGFIKLIKEIKLNKSDPRDGSIGENAVSLYYWTVFERCKINKQTDCEKLTDALFTLLDIRNPKTTMGLLHYKEWRGFIEGTNKKLIIATANFRNGLYDVVRYNKIQTSSYWDLALKASSNNVRTALQLTGILLSRNNEIYEYILPSDMKNPQLSCQLRNIEFLNTLISEMKSKLSKNDQIRFFLPKEYWILDDSFYHFYHRAYLAVSLFDQGFSEEEAFVGAEGFGYAYEVFSDLARIVHYKKIIPSINEKTHWDLFNNHNGALFGLRSLDPDMLSHYKIKFQVPLNFHILPWNFVQKSIVRIMELDPTETSVEEIPLPIPTNKTRSPELCPPCCKQ